MVSGDKRALRAFLALQSLFALSEAVIMLAQYVTYIPSALLTPFAIASTLLLPGFALVWAIEGASIWKMRRIRILVWSILLSFGLNLLILFILNLAVGMFVWQVLLVEQACVLCFSAIGYKREKGALKELGEATMPLCPNCGELVRPMDEFCTNCGSSLRGKSSEDKIPNGST